MALFVSGLSLAAAGCSQGSQHGFQGGCEKFGVYSQDRWSPPGAAERKTPDRAAQKIGGFAGNKVIAVDGWIHSGKPAYPKDSPPWNSDIWFHVASNPEGWVDFAAVRGERTSFDPTGLLSGGKPARTSPACEGAYKP